MKNFNKPECEVVRFNNNIIASSSCGCWDEETDWGAGANCTGDIAYCSCQVNHNPANDNCTPCATNQGA